MESKSSGEFTGPGATIIMLICKVVMESQTVRYYILCIVWNNLRVFIYPMDIYEDGQKL